MTFEILLSIFSIIIAGLGQYLTYIKMKKTFENERKHRQEDIQLQKISDIPHQILMLLDNILFNIVREKDPKKIQDTQLQVFNDSRKLQSEIYSYGSADAIKIMAKLQELNVQHNNELSSDNNKKIIVLYILLVTQLKYDITGVVVNPIFWFRIKLNDFEDTKDNFIKFNNAFVDLLNLNPSFKYYED